MERHISIGLDGDVPVPVSNSDDSEHFHCPFCKYAGAKIMVENHIKGHASVRHQEFTMFKCGLACRGATHFHCCYCPATIVNRLQFLRHLKIHQEEEPHAATPARHQDTPTQHPVSPAQGPEFSARHQDTPTQLATQKKFTCPHCKRRQRPCRSWENGTERIVYLRTPLRQQAGVTRDPSRENFPFPRSSAWTMKLV
ncbi:uncharacterized protein LOC121639378 isoform X2 [Melanotaenia boesemani]|uniref:uncharacterized protein LOC121639378 isoform X2 n=1 Tax=Melanotaenia boesemani TaxID=1250792 RepID=UPI001C042877|nr:uncharacterized protein LOC121639378 isoform X2 [Melanotaenia boesemani]